MRFRLPPAFYDDHVSRDLPSGTEIRRTARYVEVEATDEEASEIYSDAEYYSNATGGPDWLEGNGIRASARATVKAMRAQGFIDRLALARFMRESGQGPRDFSWNDLNPESRAAWLRLSDTVIRFMRKERAL